MSGLMQLLEGELGNELINGLSNETHVEKDKTAEVLSMALPLLMGAMKKNTRKSEMADGLMGAVGSDRHDGSILDDLGGLFQGGVNQEVLDDGNGILGHLFGGQQPEVENQLSKRTGLDTANIGKMLMTLAPIAMGLLGRQTRQQNINSSGDLNTLLGSMLGGQPTQNRDLITSLLDADGDGSVLDDVSDIVLGSKGKKSGLSGLLDGLFGG